MRKLKLFLSLLMLISFSVGTVWGQAPAGTTLFSEDFSSYKKDNVPTGSVTTATGRVVYGNANVTYSVTNGGGTTKIYTENTAGGTSPEILVAKSSGTFVVAGIPSGDAKVITVSYKQNKQELTVAASGTGYSGSLKNKPSSSVTNSFDITVADGAAATFTLTFTGSGSSNVRVDDILVTVKTAGEGATPTCVNPTFDPIDGTKFTESQDVEISTETEGATIYYTLDGSTPTTSSNVYSSAINLTATTTIKAIAAKTDYDNSSVVSATYTKVIPVPGYDVDFESELDLYTDWKFTNAAIGTNGDNTNINAHAGTHYGTTGGKSTASYETKAKIANPGTFTCYVSKQSTNTTTSTWYIQVSSDASSWTDVKSQSATNMSAGEWVEFSANLSAYNNVYVRLYYSGGTAVRNVDDISLQMAATKYNITISDAIEHGTVTSDKSTATAGETVTLTATPATNYRLASWSVNDGAVTVTNNQFTMPEGNVTVSATFEEDVYAVTVTNPSHGTITVLDGEDPIGANVLKGKTLTVSAASNAPTAYRVSNLRAFLTATPATPVAITDGQLTMPGEAITITADETALYAVSVAISVLDKDDQPASSEGFDVKINGGSVAYVASDAEELSLVAAEKAGYDFVNWTYDNEKILVDKDDEASTTAYAYEAVTVTAHYKEKSTPEMTVSKDAIDFGAIDYKEELAAQSFTIEGANLAGSKITIAWEENSDEDAFDLSATEVAITDGAANATITVTPRRDVCGDFTGQLNISTTGVATQTVMLGLKVNKLAHGLVWSSDAATVTIDGDDNVFPTLSNPHKLQIELSSENDDIATFDEGHIVLVAPGTVKIYANTVGSNDTVALPAENAVFYTLTVQKKYTAKWYVNGTPVDEQTDLAGTSLKAFPSDFSSFTDCSELEFQGWLTAPLGEASASKPAGLITETTGLTMPEEDINYYAVFATKNEEVTKVEYQYTIATTDFNTTSYAANNNEKTVNAVCTTDESKKLEVKFTSYQVMKNNTTGIQGQKNTGAIYNAAAWGTKIKSITINDNANYTYVIGAESEPTTTAEGAFFKISAGSSTSTATSIDIVFEVSNKSTTYSDYVTSCPSCTEVELNAVEVEHGSIALSSTLVKTCDPAKVTVTPDPATGYELTNVALSGVAGATYADGEISIPAEASGTLDVTATFSAINYTVTMAQTGDASSTISGNQNNKHYNDVITVTATAVDGYYFLGWEADVEVAFDNAKALETTFPMPNGNVTVTAKFAKILTVSEAITLIPNADDTYDNAVVEGYISSAATSDKEGTLTYNIRAIDANGFLTGSELQVFRGKGLNGADFSNLDDVEIGAKVFIYGQLKNYYGTRELNSNNYLLSYDAGSYLGVDIYGEATETEYEVGDEFKFDGLSAKHAWSNGYAEAIENPIWTADPAIIAANTTSVSVTAKDDDNTSAPVEVDVTVLTHAVIFSNPEHGSLVVKQGDDAITSGDKFVKGTNLQVVATPDEDYYLESLTVNGTIDILDSRNFNMPAAAANVVAVFAEKLVADISWTKDAVIVIKGGSYDALPTLNNDDDFPIVYESTNTDVAEIAANGDVTINAAGTTTIKAIFAGDEVTKAKTASYTLTVRPTVVMKGTWDEWAAEVVLVMAEDGATASAKKNFDGNTWPQFKLIIDGEWRGLPKDGDNLYKLHRGWPYAQFAGEGDNALLQADFTGEYTFTWAYETNTLTISFPDVPASKYYIAGDFTDPGWADDLHAMIEVEGVWSTALDLDKESEYNFKVVCKQDVYTTWYGLNSWAQMKEDDCTDWIIGGGDANIGLLTTAAASYTFRFTPSEMKLTVDIPETPSAINNIDSNEAVVKTMENGVLIIRRGNKTFNAQGQLLK